MNRESQSRPQTEPAETLRRLTAQHLFEQEQGRREEQHRGSGVPKDIRQVECPGLRRLLARHRIQQRIMRRAERTKQFEALGIRRLRLQRIKHLRDVFQRSDAVELLDELAIIPNEFIVDRGSPNQRARQANQRNHQIRHPDDAEIFVGSNHD